MYEIGSIAGVDVIFGARWDDAGEGARLKTKFRGTVGFYDGGRPDRKVHPAPAVARGMFEVEDALATHAVFYRDDGGAVFGSIVFSAGEVAPLSETVYGTSGEWEDAIVRSTGDANIDLVFFPEGTAAPSDGKHRVFEVSDARLDMDSLPAVKPRPGAGTLAAAASAVVVPIAVAAGAWFFAAHPLKEDVDDIEFVVERIKPDYSGILERCGRDLDEPWPVPPEWTLKREGCVAAPDLAEIAFPKPPGQRPYAYRFYELDIQRWDAFLSRASFLKMAERFPGSVVEGSNRFLLYLSYDLGRHVVADDYVPDTDPAGILRRSFVGAVDLGRGSRVGGVSGLTDLELEPTLERLSGKRLTPNHVHRDFEGRRTRMEVSPERVETREVEIR